MSKEWCRLHHDLYPEDQWLHRQSRFLTHALNIYSSGNCDRISRSSLKQYDVYEQLILI